MVERQDLAVRHVRRACALALLLMCPSVLWAQDDYSDKDFSLRLPPAFIRFIEVSAAGGGTVANRLSSSVNPASADWTHAPSKHGMIMAPYYSLVAFEEGTRLHVTGESFTWDTRKWGTIQPSTVQIRSNRATNRMGLTFDYTVDYAQLQWAKRCGDSAIGVNVNYAKANITQDFGLLRVNDGDAENYRVRVGGLHQLAEKWLLGMAVEYGFSPYDADAMALTPQGPVPVRLRGTQHEFILRPGVSYEYAPYSTVYADYQYGRFGNKGAHLLSHWWVAGVDHRLLQWLFVRASSSIDARGNAGATCGLGAYVSRRCLIDLGYQYDVLPELQPEFGRSQLFQFTLSAWF